jgi:nucleoside-diphosphate-sugar epimerase
MTRVAAVTGGAGAIGGAIVAGLRAAGHEVVILDRDGDPPIDLAEPDAVRAAAAGVLGRHGRCDVLVHAVGAITGQTLCADGGLILR